MTINISTLPIKTTRNPTDCPRMSPINLRNVRRGMCGHAKLPTKFQIKKPNKRTTIGGIEGIGGEMVRRAAVLFITLNSAHLGSGRVNVFDIHIFAYSSV